MRKLRRLVEATRALSAHGQVALRGIPDRDDWWVCIISVGGVILFESAAGPLEFVLDEALRKMSTMSQRVKLALRLNSSGAVVADEEDEDDDDDKDES